MGPVSSGSASGSGSNVGSGRAMATGSSGMSDAGTLPVGDDGGAAQQQPDVGAPGIGDGGPAPGRDGGNGDGATGGGSSDATSGGCVPWGQGLIGSNTAPASYTTAVFGCDGGVTGFCDNGVRQMPPTCDPIVDALIARTPPTCASVNAPQYQLDRDPKDPDNLLAHFTADMCNLKGAVYWVSKMNIDCDGKMTAQCPGIGANMDPSYLPDTAVHANGAPLTSSKDPYVVLPSDNAQIISQGGVVAVVYGRKVAYAIFGDTGPPNADDPTRLLGEGSVALANALGIPSSPAIGGAVGKVVTYIAFTGNNTVPANLEDQNEIDALGKQLTAKFIADNP
jgi:Fungal chitosanase of glycosyl hydrolase group 75